MPCPLPLTTLRNRENPLVVLIGDGAYDEETLNSVVWENPAGAKDLASIDLGGIDVRYLPVGKATENVGITAFNVRRYIANKMSYEVYIEVQNFGDVPARRELLTLPGWLGDQDDDPRAQASRTDLAHLQGPERRNRQSSTRRIGATWNRSQGRRNRKPRSATN